MVNYPLIDYLQGKEVEIVTAGSEDATAHKMSKIDLKCRALRSSAAKMDHAFWVRYSGKIVVIDDDPMVLRIAKKALPQAVMFHVAETY